MPRSRFSFLHGPGISSGAMKRCWSWQYPGAYRRDILRRIFLGTGDGGMSSLPLFLFRYTSRSSGLIRTSQNRLQSIYSLLPYFFAIIMFHELSIPVTMKLVALGHPLDEAKRLADAITLQLVLLCTLLGYRMVRPDKEGRMAERAVMLRPCGVFSRVIRGVLPAPAGNAGSCSRSLLPS
jgi:hypothetical protein